MFFRGASPHFQTNPLFDVLRVHTDTSMHFLWYFLPMSRPVQSERLCLWPHLKSLKASWVASWVIAANALSLGLCSTSPDVWDHSAETPKRTKVTALKLCHMKPDYSQWNWDMNILCLSIAWEVLYHTKCHTNTLCRRVQASPPTDKHPLNQACCFEELSLHTSILSSANIIRIIREMGPQLPFTSTCIIRDQP